MSSLRCNRPGDPRSAVGLYRHGIVSNPDDFAIQNNLAFSLALSDMPDKAESVLKMVNANGLTEKDLLVYTETLGLIAYRAGNHEMGKRLYDEAVQKSRRIKEPKREATALIYQAFEEIRIGSQESESIRNAALEHSKVLNERWHSPLIQRLRLYQPQRYSTPPN